MAIELGFDYGETVKIMLTLSPDRAMSVKSTFLL